MNRFASPAFILASSLALSAGCGETASDPAPTLDLDVTPPTLSITRINGYAVCPDGTLKVTAPGDCVDAIPAVTFSRNQQFVVEVQADDDRRLTDLAFQAFGSGVSDSDQVFVGAGTHAAGTPLTVVFAGLVGSAAIPGDAQVVARATDSSGNVATSRAARLRIDIGLRASAGREIEPVAGGPSLNAAYDVVVNPVSGAIEVAKRDTLDPALVRVLGPAVVPVATFDQRPEYLAADALGNVYVSIDLGSEIMQVAPNGSVVFYQGPGSPSPMLDPEGLAVLDAATPSTGMFLFLGSVLDGATVTVDATVFEFDLAGGCTGGRFCVPTTGVRDDAMAALAAAISLSGATSPLVTAGRGVNCAASGNPCVFLVQNTPGVSTPPALSDTSATITSIPISGGRDAPLLFGLERNSGTVNEYQAAAAPNSALLRTYSLGTSVGRGVAAALRGGPAARLFLFAVDEMNDQLRGYDRATDRSFIVAGGGDGLNFPFDVVITSTDCALVSNRGSGEILAVSGLDGMPSPGIEVVASGFRSPRGLAMEGSGSSASLLVTDDFFDLVVRILPTPDPTDCF
jgi:hypothetical protein